MNFLDKLNPQQLEAVRTTNGPILILAGAGSGKTRVITYRIAHMIEAGGVRPERILAVTFTNKAAQEMKSRVEAMLNTERRVSSPLISTFHALCVRILRRDIERMGAGYNRNFTIYDEDDQARVARAIIKELGLDDKSITPRQALSAISWAKSRGISPVAYTNQSDYASDRTEKIAQIYRIYEQRLQQANALDFDDLLIKAVQLLRQIPEVRAYYHERFRHVMIDEFQDTNGIQYELARLITVGTEKLERGGVTPEDFWEDRSLCVVGDIDQSVYSWRGSDFNIILGFQHDFEGTKMIKLEQNYRSTQTILDAANTVIERNKQRLPKTLRATEELGAGEKIRYYQSYDGEGEASFVAEKIQEQLRRSPDTKVAVLYRTNSQSRLFEESLRRRGINYNIVGGFSFYERAEVKDIISYLKLSLNPDDDIALGRIINSPPRGIGKTTLDSLHRMQKDLGVSLYETIRIAVGQKSLGPRASASLDVFLQVIDGLRERAASGQTVSEVVKAATHETGYVRALQDEKTEEAESRLLNIEELVTAAVEAEEQGETLRDFIDHAALVSDTDQYRSDARVTLMTMHAAKGLEFPVVFIAGMEEGLFPHSRAAGSDEELEEERRLCYVAITRAQKDLYISHAMKRRTWGEEHSAEPSRFLNEIPLDLMQNLSPGPSWLGFAERPETRHNREAASALRGEAARPVKKSSNFTGKTYNSVESVQDFFKRKVEGAAEPRPRAGQGAGQSQKPGSGDYRVGARVKHARYGTGVILRTEGAGEDAKLTVSFPGYGQKKFVAKFAALEKA
ncbi:MAG TPA: UvrD-helicase domain-containing protein [Blastocatellia bacterium]|nr:UvrD-helicase domain-containing protein [Blastocatellia bacterium]